MANNVQKPGNHGYALAKGLFEINGDDLVLGGLPVRASVGEVGSPA